jgi:hypothetical protein
LPPKEQYIFTRPSRELAATEFFLAYIALCSTPKLCQEKLQIKVNLIHKVVLCNGGSVSREEGLQKATI